MIDHVLGRPSTTYKRIQTIITVLISIYLIRSLPNRPHSSFLRKINTWFHGIPPYKVVGITLVVSFVYENLLCMCGMGPPEPYAKMYTRNFYRATYIMTSLDAAFLSTSHIRPRILSQFLSIILTITYLFYPSRADEIVRKHRHHVTVNMLRTMWHKSSHPVLRFLSGRDRGYIPIRTDIRIPIHKPGPTAFPNTPKTFINARLYFDGTVDQLRQCNDLVIQIPGGGFVTMSPIHHDDYVSNWARQTRIPIVSFDYGKSPEHPYPFALEQCYDAYKSIVHTNGECIGLGGWTDTDTHGRVIRHRKPIRVVMVGDSAGANIATGVIFRCIEGYGGESLRVPVSFISIYPCLSFDMACWMPASQLNILRSESNTNLTSILDTKLKIRQLSPLETRDAPRSIDVIHDKVDRRDSWYQKYRRQTKKQEETGPLIPSALSMTSRMSFFNDRVIPPELLRGMALMYLAACPFYPDLTHDYYLSPVIAPEEVLARFPKCYLMCGEKDPFVDDTVVFGGRLREAKMKAHREWEKMRERRRGSSSASAGGAATAGGGGVPMRNRRRSIGEMSGLRMSSMASIGSQSSSSNVYDEERGNMKQTTSPQQSPYESIRQETMRESRGVETRGSIRESNSNSSGFGGNSSGSGGNSSGFGGNSSGMGNPLNGTTTLEEQEFEKHIFSHEADEMVQVKILEGVSHGFFQMLSFLPEAKQAVRVTSEWIKESFVQEEEERVDGELTEMIVGGLEKESVVNEYAYYRVGGVGPGNVVYEQNFGNRKSRVEEVIPPGRMGNAKVVVENELKEVQEGGLMKKRRSSIVKQLQM